MWYVIQTMSGQERAVRALIETWGDARPGLVEQCFIPMRERTVKYQGSWKLVEEKLFPGYVFVVTQDARRLYRMLKEMPRFARLLSAGTSEFVPLSQAEIDFIQGFGDDGHVVRLSQVEVVEGSRVRIVSGALLNCEGQIAKVNLHKRIAEVRTEFMGQPVKVFLGIELLGRPSRPAE
ncbi:MAG: antiterminator LoaP [Candidatus Faecivicinus sp.]